MNRETKFKEEVEGLDLVELIKVIYIHKKFILRTTIVFFLIGAIYSVLLPNKFTSSTTFIPQLSSGVKTSSESSLTGLASLAGISLGGMESSSEFPPTLYPQVVEGIPFRTDLLSSLINFQNDSITVRNYLLNKQSLNLFNKIHNQEEYFFTENSLYKITEQDEKLFDYLNKFLSLSINDKEGFITISFSDENNSIAAQVTQIAQNLLQKKIIDFKNRSSKEMLEFAQKQYFEKRKTHDKLQDDRAVFVDKNINISSSLFQNKLSRIESEVDISQAIVQQLASQVEQAKLKVNKDTPVFTTIKPVTISYEKSGPKRILIILAFLFIGFILSSFYVLLKDPAKDFIESIKS